MMNNNRGKITIKARNKLTQTPVKMSRLPIPTPAFLPHPLWQAIREVMVRPGQHWPRVGQWQGGMVAATLISLTHPVLGQSLNLSDLDGHNGFKLNGEMAADRSGTSVAAAGDINGDGIDDIIIGAPGGMPPDEYFYGASYVVFGSEQGFNKQINLSTLDSRNGFQIMSEVRYDYSGLSVSAAGDINGDGLDDLIIGAMYSSNGFRSGASYVVFGSDQGISTPWLELSSLDGTNGFKINGERKFNLSGKSVSAAGDVNGDGIDDVIIGGSYGSSYVVFGSDQGFSTPIELSTLNGTNGFKLNGSSSAVNAGSSVSAAGDVNGDGLGDIIIGADLADPNGHRSGASYVVFGDDQGFRTPIELSSLNGTNGFKLNGEASYDRSGISVSAAGDMNSDGIDDVIIGAIYAGASYVVFGSNQGFRTPIELSSLDGSNGFKIEGGANSDYPGSSVSEAGDVNGDGIDDVILGDYLSAGTSYVVFGSDQGFHSNLELSSLNGTNGFKLNGDAARDNSGWSVSAAGDVNGDGIDDVIIGAPRAAPNGFDNAGASYVVFGALTAGQEAASPMLVSLGDIMGNGSQDIAILVHNVTARTVTATIKDAEYSSSIHQVAFNGILKPIDLDVMDDINANGAPELVVLGQGSIQAEVRDSLTGESLGTVDFDPDVTPVDLEIIPDQDGNGIPELAVLGDSPAQVEVRDALTGNLVYTVNYTDNITPVDMVVLPDSNNKGGPEIGVLGEHDEPTKNNRVELRDLLNGKWVRNLFYGKLKVQQAEVISDLNNNGTPEIAVLRTSEGQVNVQIKDTLTKAHVRHIGYDPSFAPEELLILPDVNGNGAAEIAVFGKNQNNQSLKAQIKDGKTKKLIRTMFFDKSYTPVDLVVMPDINGNGASEIAMLGAQRDSDQMRLIIKDSKSGALVGTVNF